VLGSTLPKASRRCGALDVEPVEEREERFRIGAVTLDVGVVLASVLD
jgi:hypothetical protein